MENLGDNQYQARFLFIETLTAQSIAMTGRGIYVYLSPIEIDQLYGRYQNLSSPIEDFARQCVKAALGR